MLTPRRIDQITREGRAASALLSEPCFVEVFNYLSDYHLAALVAAPPGAGEAQLAREHHHLMLHALREIQGELDSRVNTLTEFEQRWHTEEEEDTE